MTKKIKVQCPKCTATFNANQRGYSKKRECPKCDKKVRMKLYIKDNKGYRKFVIIGSLIFVVIGFASAEPVITYPFFAIALCHFFARGVLRPILHSFIYFMILMCVFAATGDLKDSSPRSIKKVKPKVAKKSVKKPKVVSKPKKTEEVILREKFERQFDADGSHWASKLIIKENMDYPDSFKHIKTNHHRVNDKIKVTTTFRGKNAYGVFVTNQFVSFFNADGDKVPEEKRKLKIYEANLNNINEPTEWDMQNKHLYAQWYNRVIKMDNEMLFSIRRFKNGEILEHELIKEMNVLREMFHDSKRDLEKVNHTGFEIYMAYRLNDILYMLNKAGRDDVFLEARSLYLKHMKETQVFTKKLGYNHKLPQEF